MRKSLFLIIVLLGLWYVIDRQVVATPSSNSSAGAAISSSTASSTPTGNAATSNSVAVSDAKSATNSEATAVTNPEAVLAIQSGEQHTDLVSCHHDSDEKSVILVLGDSLSSGLGIDKKLGWVNLLQSRLQQQRFGFEVFNASISGDTTSGGLARLKKKLPELQPRIVIIELGGNDGLRALPLPVMQRNLNQMIELSQQAGAQPVLMGMRIPSNYGPRYTEKFHQIYVDLAQQHDVPLAPFFLENVALNDNLMQADGIHPNAQAQSLLLDNAWPAIKQAVQTACKR